ncbi:MAG: carboxypeptidase regulatory-like domain-containing protein [Candidatus Omnitrophota bacterium]
MRNFVKISGISIIFAMVIAFAIPQVLGEGPSKWPVELSKKEFYKEDYITLLGMFSKTIEITKTYYDPGPIKMGDVSGDGVSDISFIATNSTTGYNSVYLLNKDGVIYDGWPKELDCNSGVAPALVDLDEDGNMEIIVNTTSDGIKIYTWEFDGSLVKNFPIKIPGTEGSSSIDEKGRYYLTTTSYSIPAIGDVDGDGIEDLVVTGTTIKDYGNQLKNETINKIWAVSLGSGQMTLSGWPVTLEKGENLPYWNSPAIADIDNDGTMEVIIGINRPCGDKLDKDTYRVYVFNCDGKPFNENWPKDLKLDNITLEKTLGITSDFYRSKDSKFGFMTSPVVADVNGDNKEEIVIAGSYLNYFIAPNELGLGSEYDTPFIEANSILYVMDKDAFILEGWPRIIGTSLIHQAFKYIDPSISIGDVDYDSIPDISLPGYDGNIHILNYMADEILKIESLDFYKKYFYTLIGDINNDFKVDIVAPALENIICAFDTDGKYLNDFTPKRMEGDTDFVNPLIVACPAIDNIEMRDYLSIISPSSKNKNVSNYPAGIINKWDAGDTGLIGDIKETSIIDWPQFAYDAKNTNWHLSNEKTNRSGDDKDDKLQKKNTISGYVASSIQDDYGRRLFYFEGVKVRAIVWDPILKVYGPIHSEVFTGPDGTYEFPEEDMVPGTIYSIVANPLEKAPYPKLEYKEKYVGDVVEFAFGPIYKHSDCFGQAFDRETGKALEGVTVKLRADSDFKIYSGVSNNNGWFLIQGLPYLSFYDVFASKKGYKEEQRGPIDIKQDPFYRITNPDLSLVPIPKGSISGKVMDGAIGVEGMVVEAIDKDGDIYSDTTDASGEYEIKDLLENYNYTVTVGEKEGYKGSIPTKHEVTVVGNILNIDFTLQKTSYSISGVIYNEDGSKRLHPSTVKLEGTSASVLTMEDPDKPGEFGYYEVAGLEEDGYYILTVSSDGYIPVSRGFIDLREDTKFDFHLKKPPERYNITVNVRDENNKLVPRAHVGIVGFGYDIDVGYDGILEWEGLFGGEKTFWASKDGKYGETKAVIEENGVVVDIVLKENRYSLSGIVTERGANIPLKDVIIKIKLPNGIEKAARSNSNGYYLIKDMPNGKYMASCTKEREGGIWYHGYRLEVVISGKNKTLDLTLAKGEYLYTVTGRVVDEDGDPVKGATVRPDGLGQRLTTDRSGEYSLLLPAKTYLFIAELNGKRGERSITVKEENTRVEDIIIR